MMRVDRRRLLASAAGLLAAPSASNAATRASDFENEALQGFVFGGVERDPLLLDAMVGFGANLARVFLRWRRPGGTGRFVVPQQDLGSLQRLLDRADALDIRLIVTGTFEGADDAAFWSDRAAQDEFTDTWHLLARRFAGAPALAGFDLLNEPIPPMPSGDLREGQGVWRALAVRTIAAIRSESRTVPVLFEPVAGGNVMGLQGFEPIDDPQLVYSIHFYTPHDITHQGVAPMWTRKIPYPAGIEWKLGAWDRELGVTPIDATRLERELRVGRAFQLRYGVPIQVGEFSCVRWAPNGSAPRWVGDCLELFRRYGWSWTYHEFRGWPGWDAELTADQGDNGVRNADAPVMKLIRNAIARRNGAHASRGVVS